MPHYFLLSHKGARARVDAWRREEETEIPGLNNIRWEIIRIHWTADSVEAKAAFKELLIEALTCFGKYGMQGAYLNVDRVEVDFSVAQEV
ncbi:MAG: hypothetical protein R2940_11975 [Syntrophotaleaceae bacterium]